MNLMHFSSLLLIFERTTSVDRRSYNRKEIVLKNERCMLRIQSSYNISILSVSDICRLNIQRTKVILISADELSMKNLKIQIRSPKKESGKNYKAHIL